MATMRTGRRLNIHLHVKSMHRYESIERVVNGTFHMQKNWLERNHLPWDPLKAQKVAQEMYRRIFEMKFLPPGRGETNDRKLTHLEACGQWELLSPKKRGCMLR